MRSEIITSTLNLGLPLAVLPTFVEVHNIPAHGAECSLASWLQVIIEVCFGNAVLTGKQCISNAGARSLLPYAVLRAQPGCMQLKTLSWSATPIMGMVRRKFFWRTRPPIIGS